MFLYEYENGLRPSHFRNSKMIIVSGGIYSKKDLRFSLAGLPRLHPWSEPVIRLVRRMQDKVRDS